MLRNLTSSIDFPDGGALPSAATMTPPNKAQLSWGVPQAVCHSLGALVLSGASALIPQFPRLWAKTLLQTSFPLIYNC